MNLAYYLLTKNLSLEDRQEFDTVVLSRPEAVNPDTGLRPPAWWQGEEDAAESAVAFARSTRR